MKSKILKDYEKLLADKNSKLHFLCHFLENYDLKGKFNEYLVIERISQNWGNNVTSWFFDESNEYDYDGLIHYSDCLRYLILEDFLNKLD